MTKLDQWYDIEINIKVKDRYEDGNEEELTIRTLETIRRLILEAEIDYQMRGLETLSKEAENYENAFNEKIAELKSKLQEKR